MATDFLSLFAAQHGFRYYRQKIYGTYNGYDVCIASEMGVLAYYFNTQVTEMNSFLKFMEEESKEYGVLTYRLSPPIVAVLSEQDKLISVLDFVTQLLSLCKATTSELCSFCGMRLNQSERTYFVVDGVVCVSHERCYEQYNGKINKDAEDRKALERPWYSVMLFPILFSFIISLVSIMFTMRLVDMAGAVYAFGCFLLGYASSGAYYGKQGRGGLQAYLSCGLITLVFVFVIQAGYQSLGIMRTYDVTFVAALGQFFAYYGDWSIVISKLLPELGIGVLIGLLGIALRSFSRHQSIEQSKVNIHKL